jgi:16S rRNA G966 N2-methylase RsmD
MRRCACAARDDLVSPPSRHAVAYANEVPSGTSSTRGNLDVLRQHIADESVDLIYLDPPFNSNATYRV